MFRGQGKMRAYCYSVGVALVLTSATLVASARSVVNLVNNNNDVAGTFSSTEGGCSWELVASPDLIVPGEETLVFVAPLRCNFSEISNDLMATLTVFEEHRHKVIHGMVWQVEATASATSAASTASIEAGVFNHPTDLNLILPVQFRLPASIPTSGTRGVLRLHSQSGCHPFVEAQPEDECPRLLPEQERRGCERGRCLVIPFRLAPTLRQIVLVTDRIHYARGDQVKIRFQPLDEATRPRWPPELTISMTDASGSLIYEWKEGYLQNPNGLHEKREVFKELVYPLGGKASEGRWKVCAHDGNEADDSKKNNMECVDFYVGDLAASESEAEPDLLNLEDNPNSVEHFVKLEFDEDMRRDFRPGVPYSGKIMVASTEDELEVVVKLMDPKMEAVLDQQTLLISTEAVFQFGPITSAAPEELSIEAYLVSNGGLGGRDIDVVNLEIDEVELDRDQEEQRETLLASAMIHKEKPSRQRYICPIWTSGLERSFKTGDFATAIVTSEAGCECNRGHWLNWVVVREGQYVAFGQARPEVSTGQCVYKIGLEVTARMAPKAIFRAWRPIYGEAAERPELSMNPSNKQQQQQQPLNSLHQMSTSYDEQNITVSLEDRALVILEVNRTEVSHSGEAVGIEVFAEPDSIICLRGYAKESGAVSPYYSSSNDGDAVAGRRKIRVFGSGLSTRKTWFFRCGNASEDGFYTTYGDAPEEGGEWIVEAMSMSPFHGLRLAQPQKILRTKPIEVGINGLAASIRRGEILSNVNVVTRNNMPIPLQLTVIATASDKTVHFDTQDGLHYSVRQLNASGEETVVSVNKLYISDLGGPRGQVNITVHVTAVAFLNGLFKEVDSLRITQRLYIRPRGLAEAETQLDYFCNEGDVNKLEVAPDGQLRFPLNPEDTRVNFSLKSDDDVVLIIGGRGAGGLETGELSGNISTSFSYKLAIGADENSAVRLFIVKNPASPAVKNPAEERLQTRIIPSILSASEARDFWLSWDVDLAHQGRLQFGRADSERSERRSARRGDFEPLITWPLPVDFQPTEILVDKIPGAHTDIRFWRGQDQQTSQASSRSKKNGNGGGHNRIFYTNNGLAASQNKSTASVEDAHITLSSGLILPNFGALKNPGNAERLTSFHELMDKLRDAAGLSQILRLEAAATSNSQRTAASNRLKQEEHLEILHRLSQDLMYFRNVDGSFGEPLVQQSLRMALEQFHLLDEINSFYRLTPFLLSGLEKWIVKEISKTAPGLAEGKNTNTNLNTIKIARDILEWAPRDSQIFHLYGLKSTRVLQEHLETLRDEGLSKTPEFAHFLAVFVHSNHDEAGNLLVDQILEDGLHYGGGCDLGDLDSLTSGLWTMSLLPRTASHFNAKSAQVFECVYSNSARILSSEVGYRVIRALVSYQMRNAKNKNVRQDLKVSLATSEDMAHTKMFHLTEAVNNLVSVEAEDGEAVVEAGSVHEVDLKRPIPEKLLFLATGEGCATVEMTTTKDTFEVNKNPSQNSLYNLSLEISSDNENHTSLFLTLCLASNHGKNIPTSIAMDFFTGYEFETLTSSDENGNDLASHWAINHQENSCILHTKVVESSCGTCATLKFNKRFTVNNLGPTSIEVFPTLQPLKAKQLFFHYDKFLDKNDSRIDDQPQWIPGGMSVKSTEELSPICPCHFKCQSEVTATTTTTTTTVNPTSTTSGSRQSSTSPATTTATTATSSTTTATTSKSEITTTFTTAAGTTIPATTPTPTTPSTTATSSTMKKQTENTRDGSPT